MWLELLIQNQGEWNILLFVIDDIRPFALWLLASYDKFEVSIPKKCNLVESKKCTGLSCMTF